MVILGQKINLPKTCQKRFYKHIMDLLCKKRPPKKISYSRNETILKIGKMATMQKLYSLWKMVILGQEINLPKTFEKRFYKHITDLLCKKRLQKAPNIREIRRFWNLQKWPLCKKYSLCKMVILGQKIKLPKTCEKRLYKHITDVLCRKRPPKKISYSKNERISKIGKMATMQKI